MNRSMLAADVGQVGFPFQLDGRGRMESPFPEQRLEQLLEQLLFTVPGERVNRPDLGCALLPTVFSAISQEQLNALRMLVQAAIEQWLGDRLKVSEIVLAAPAGDSLEIRVRYRDLRRPGMRRIKLRLGRP